MKRLLPLLFLASCASATMVQEVKNPKYAPKGYKQIGIVKYLNQGANSVIDSRREDAFKKMHDQCRSSDYKILREFTDEQGKSWSKDEFGVSEYTSQYVYLEFQCGQRAPASK